MQRFGDGVRARARGSIPGEKTREPGAEAALPPILTEPIALMPDAHLGFGATIGSVIPTESAVIPSAVGVDIGCGMAARKVDVHGTRAIEHSQAWVHGCQAHVPAGMGKGRSEFS